MTLDNSGTDLALIFYGSGMKMVILASLIANLLIPVGLGIILSLLSYLGIILILAIIIATLETSFARLRMSHIFEFIFIMSSLSLIILSLTTIKLYGN